MRISYNEFIEVLSYGGECEFTIRGNDYWISQSEEGLHFTRSNVEYYTFDDINKLLNARLLYNKTLYELWDEIIFQVIL